MKKAHLTYLFLFILGLGYFTLNIDANPAPSLIPDNHIIDWTPGVNVGVVGGIPTNRTQCDTAACTDLVNAAAEYKDGSTNAAPLIQAAIDSALPHTYVYIPAGTWRLNLALNLSASRDFITVRGAGMDVTILDCRSSVCMYGGSQASYQPYVTINSGLTRGSTQISVSDTSPYAVGDVIKIAAHNDPTLPVVSTSGFDHMRIQMVRITAKTGSTLSFFPALYDDYTTEGADVTYSGYRGEGMGVEELTADGENGSVAFGIWFSETDNSWIKNVKLIHMSNYTVYFSDSLNCEMRGGYVGELNHSGSNGSGLLTSSISGCLFEDNIFVEAFPNVEYFGGSSGNVFAYNFVNNAAGIIGIDTNHAPHNTFNLFEGNIAHNLMSDGYFGGESETTVYRNWLTAAGLSASNRSEVQTQTYCMSLKRFSRNFSVIGNIFGNAASTGNCDSYGQPNIGNGAWSGTAQPSVGDWWADLNPDGTPTTAGILTARTTDTVGQITLSSGTVAQGGALIVYYGSLSKTVLVTAINGNVVDVDTSAFAGVLPPLDSVLLIWPGSSGFQELDLDVASTTLLLANYRRGLGIYPNEATAVALPDSLFRTSKPEYFGSLAWPPFDPYNPVLNYQAIPAGYRYFNSAPPSADLTSPNLTNISSTTTDATATVTWNTNESATSRVSYGTTSTLYPTTSSSQTYTSQHSRTLTDLAPVTTYYFVVVSSDAAGNISTSTERTFTTAAVTVTTPATTTVATTSTTPVVTTPVSSVTSGGGSSSYVAPAAVTIQTATTTGTPSLIAMNVSSSSTTTQSPSYTFTRDLKLGMTQNDVKKLQQFLNTHGFVVAQTGNGSPTKESTYFGPATRAALIKFQRFYKITPSQGYFGFITRAFINKLSNSRAPSSITSSGSTLKLGDSNQNVKLMRTKLRSLGYFSPYGSSLKVPASAQTETTYFGIETENAVKKYQCDKNIICSGTPITTGWGVVGEKTKEALGL
ncbi:MAG: peptidoglycan-binding protein [Patescibacteria group bacterium]